MLKVCVGCRTSFDKDSDIPPTILPTKMMPVNDQNSVNILASFVTGVTSPYLGGEKGRSHVK